MEHEDKIVLGLVGEIACGKSYIADYLKTKYGSETFSFSDPIRQTLDLLGLPQTRENMVWLGTDLRTRFGQDILAKSIFRLVLKSQAPVICLPNIRLEGDITLFSVLPYFYLVRIEAEPEIRYQRLIKRGENVDDKTKTWEQFYNDAQLPTEVSIREVAKKAQFVMENNTCEANLRKQIKAVIETIRSQKNGR